MERTEPGKINYSSLKYISILFSYWLFYCLKGALIKVGMIVIIDHATIALSNHTDIYSQSPLTGDFRWDGDCKYSVKMDTTDSQY